MDVTTTQKTLTLTTSKASFRAFAILIVAEYTGMELQVQSSPEEIQQATKKSPSGTLPILEITTSSNNNNHPNNSSNVLFTTMAIAKYLARLRTDTTELVTSRLQDQVQVDAWCEFATTQCEIPACVLFYPIAGYMKFSQSAYAKAKVDFTKALQVLDHHLAQQHSSSSNDSSSSSSYYMVPSVGHVTLADIVLISTLVYPFKFVMEQSWLQTNVPHVLTWFQQCTSYPQFQAVLGQVTLCQKEIKP